MNRLRGVLVCLSLIATSFGAGPVFATEEPRGICDALDPANCLLPFPNNRFTREDSSTDTGLRIDFKAVEMPRDVAGKPIDPTEWNRNDGFSPGSIVMTFVPGLDLYKTWGTDGLVNPKVGSPVDPRDHLSDISRFEAAGAPMLIIDATTGERWPFWSELDNNASTPAGERLLLIRPAKNFLEGHRYLVGLRNLRTASGAVIPPGAEFAATMADGGYFDGLEPARRQHIRGVVSDIAAAESNRGNAFDAAELFLAWDFTVASGRNLSERVLRIRDTAFASLGDSNLADGVIAGTPPKFGNIKVTIRTDGARQKVVEGTVTVPNFLVADARPPVEEYSLNPVREATGLTQLPGDSLPGQSIPGLRFLYGPDGLPMQNPAIPTMDIPFVCTVPKLASGTNPAHPMLYGHGLLGDRNESVGGSTDRDRERNFMPCAVNWMGFAEYDVANAVATLLDPSNMPSMIDRSQQGFLNALFLGRALAHPAGLASDPAFRDSQGRPLFATGELFYDGNSQGGIMGGALIALGVDHTRAVLGVPGMNYSTLLNRSVDWEGPAVPAEAGDLPSYSSFLYTMFPDKREQQVVINLLQMIWDRGEGNGYAQHMTSDPLPNTPPHQVLLQVAYGDFQVANVSAEVEARTIGARVMQTSLMSGRHWALNPFYGLVPFNESAGSILPYAGSAIVYWDSGNLAPPNANIPPAKDGGDPHEDPRRDPNAGDQKARFWLTGDVVDVMSGGPYLLCRPGQESNIPRVPSQFDFDWCV